ncbi:MAG: hypothetical protein R6W73_02430 [Candidatus Saliniplasma sp.]
MKLILRKDLDEMEKEKIMSSIRDEFESIDRLRQKVSRTGCRKPDLVDKFKLLEALQKGAEYKEERILKSAKSISALSFRRVKLIEYVSNNRVDSINDLADGLNRDYKNVYDDLQVLSKNGLMELDKEGKRRVPILKADSIIIKF